MTKLFVFPEVRVVEASAGSGKTHALAKRYVGLLLQTAQETPLAVKHILAITFTNKAAGEMKARIIALLKRLALGQLPAQQEHELLAPLGMSAARAKVLAGSLMEDLIRNYHFFQVQTIDSFMNTLLAGCAFKINLSSRFRIKRNAADYLQLSLDELIDAAHEDKHIMRLFEVFIRQYLFLDNRGGWFPKKDLLGMLMLLFSQLNTYQKPFLTFALDGADMLEQKKSFLKLAGDLQRDLPQEVDKKFAGSLQSFLQQHSAGFDIDNVSRYFGRPQLPVRAEGEISGEQKRQWERSRQLLRSICLQEAYGSFNPYVDLFHAVMGYFGRLQTREDVLFLQQLNKKTGELFDEGAVTLGELYYRIAVRLRHYLIDEFQDTSLSQWHNLRLMIEDALAEGGSLFTVGDKKQAIYGFRGGHSRLFAHIELTYGAFNFTRETLSINRRSHRAIVEFNNRIFNPLHLGAFARALEKQDTLKDKDIVFNPSDMDRLQHVFGTACQTHRDDLPHGAVRVTLVSGRTKEQREAAIRLSLLAIVQDVRQRFALGDVAVLTRNNAQAQQVTQWLIEAGVHAQSERTSDVKRHPLICELLAFLRFVHAPVDNAAFAQFLLGQVFPKAAGLFPGELQQFLFSCRRSKAAKGEVYFYKVFREAYPKQWQEFFEEFFSRAGAYPLYELAVSLCGRLRCVELFPDAQGFVMHFLELIKRREEDGCDMETFLNYFEALEDEERFVPMPSQDAVKILTVHKAKGLEAKVVIIPFLEMTIKPGAADKKGTQSFTWDIEEGGMRLLRLKESYGRFCDELRERYAYEYKEAFFSELNNVYVALTRAVWENHVLIPERTGSRVNPVQFLVPPDMFSSGELRQPQSEAVRQPQAKQFLPVGQHQQWIDKLQEETFDEGLVRAQARRSGEIMHFCLSQLKNLSGADVAGVLEEAVAHTAGYFGPGHDWGRVREKLRLALDQPAWKPFFYLPAAAEVLCEQEMVTRKGQTRRIDRLIIFPTEVWAVDFKSSRLEEGRHQEQINEYAALLRALYPHKKTEGFLLYLDQALCLQS